MTASLLLVGPATPRDGLDERLSQLGVVVTRVEDVGGALERLATKAPALCMIDLSADDVALSAIRLIRARHPELPLAAIADLRRPVVAAEAIHAGVADVLPWPLEEHALAALLANVRDRGPVVAGPEAAEAATGVFAYSPAMREAVEALDAAEVRRGGVCFHGEPGSGRQMLARTLHERTAAGTDAPFVVVDCNLGSAVELGERLFGTIDGARHAAANQGLEPLRPGAALLAAENGTLVLRSPADAPARIQARLARVLRDGEAATESGVVVDLRLRPVAVSDVRLEAAVADGRLRRDLHARLAETTIDVPPLRQRREDMPVLATHFVRKIAASRGASAPTISRSALALLAALPWHGNAKELRTLLERLCRSTEGPVIQLEDVLQHAALDGIATRVDLGMTLRDAKAAFERECISAVLKRHHGRVGEAAKALGIQRTNLYRKVRQLKMERALLAGRR